MLPVETRPKLAEHTASSLRKLIQSGEWKKVLPTIPVLCELLRVSRGTLSDALKILAKEGIIELSHGRRTAILNSSIKQTTASRVIALLHSAPSGSILQLQSTLTSEVRRHVQNAHYTFSQYVYERSYKESLSKRLEELVQNVNAKCWIITVQQTEIQKWFQNSGVPCLIMGSCHKGVTLSSINYDYGEICRDAAVRLLELGHQRIVFLNRKNGYGGDLLAEEGFRSAFSDKDIPEVLYHNDNPEELHQDLAALFNQKNRPTALIISSPEHLMATLSLFSKLKLSIPEDVSVVSRSYSTFMDYMIPSIAHYQIDFKLVAAKVVRMALQFTPTSIPPVQNVLLKADFVPGDSMSKQ